MKSKGFLITALAFSFAGECFAQVHVNGYYRKDGTYVAPHYRTSPDAYKWNNYSARENTPYDYTIRNKRNPVQQKFNTRGQRPYDYTIGYASPVDAILEQVEIANRRKVAKEETYYRRQRDAQYFALEQRRLALEERGLNQSTNYQYTGYQNNGYQNNNRPYSSYNQPQQVDYVNQVPFQYRNPYYNNNNYQVISQQRPYR